MKAITASVPNQLNNVVPKGLQDYIKTEIDEIVPVEKIGSKWKVHFLVARKCQQACGYASLVHFKATFAGFANLNGKRNKKSL